MKIQIASDLHLEMRENNEPELHEFSPVEDRDVLVLAGDIGTYMKAWPFIEQELRRSPVIYVPGNHEYYSWLTREYTDEAWQDVARKTPDLHYLVAESVTIDGVRFWGAPWYSDLDGRRDLGYLEVVERSVNDFSPYFNDFGQWTVERHLEEHAHQTQLLREQADLVDVVITHWPPTRDAIAPRFQDHGLNGYFVNDREDLVEDIGAQIWVSGYVHDAYRAVVGNTLVIGNPTGYPDETPESGLFRPDFAINVEPEALTDWED